MILQKGETKYKLMKIIFTNDGSYSVTAPYHNEKKACLFKAAVDYRKHEQFLSLSDTIDNVELDDDDLALKISHHPSGFLHFSGKGITSRQDADGTITGIGIQSWPLSAPVPGPAFYVKIKNYQDMIKTAQSGAEDLCVNLETISADEDNTNTIVEGFFIRQQSQRYIYKENGLEYISLIHSSGVIMKLHVVRPAKINQYFGFLGLHIHTEALNSSLTYAEYSFSTSSGDVVCDENKQLLTGTCLYAMYPNITNEKLPSLNWPPKL
ncbi:hypothetical protein DYY67_0571 [Candidatus Nitrosotalea sp. TS]|nr:hypothetical protein [Candidatus Nitrosotalea sp. TS]